MKKTFIALALLYIPLSTIAAPCEAGQGDSIIICVNEPLNLFSVLNGDPDLSGQWYDSNNDSIDPQIPAGKLNIPGAYDFTYIISSSTCDNDTAYVRLSAYQCDLGLQDNLNQSVSLYPNPASELIHIKSNTATSIQPRILDLHGKTILEIPVFQDETTVDISNLPKGRYWLTFLDEGNRKRTLVFIKD